MLRKASFQTELNKYYDFIWIGEIDTSLDTQPFKIITGKTDYWDSYQDWFEPDEMELVIENSKGEIEDFRDEYALYNKLTNNGRKKPALIYIGGEDEYPRGYGDYRGLFLYHLGEGEEWIPHMNDTETGAIVWFKLFEKDCEVDIKSFNVPTQEAIKIVDDYGVRGHGVTVKNGSQIASLEGLKVTDYGYMEPPMDDLDPDFATTVEVTFSISGQLLAKLLGRQQRMVERVLKDLKPDKAIRQLHDGPASDTILKNLKRYVDRAVYDMGREEFDHDCYMERYDWGNTEYWEARIGPSSITFRVELDVLGEWD